MIKIRSEPYKGTILPGDTVPFEYHVGLPSVGKFVYALAEPGFPLKLSSSSERTLLESPSECGYKGAVPFDPFVLNPATNQLEYRFTNVGSAPEVAAKAPTADSVAIKISGDNWRYFGDTCYISLQNLGPKPIEFRLTIKGIIRMPH